MQLSRSMRGFFSRVHCENLVKLQEIKLTNMWISLMIWSHGFSFFFFFTSQYWFCHTLTWIHHRCTCVPYPEPSSHFPPHPIPLGHPSAPAPSIQYHASNLDWRFISYMILYMFQCHSPKSSHPRPLPKRLFYTSVSLLLSCIQGYYYYLSKFHIYVLVYCIGVFPSGLLQTCLYLSLPFSKTSITITFWICYCDIK